ncbi:uncharacterized protein LOC124271495 [Haliotis rubra]|uniref:uncharacterized protein LOC124271495 n=1 Tax=Haliotis rubra TaxID=36100 RepID=UPI001EE62A7C|nr:uncharacterized protein LOC124271495 [Haliotis rubra]
MMKLALIFLSFTPVLIVKTTKVRYHLYDRITSLDNLQTAETPSSFRQTQSFLECGSVCSQDELCVAIVLHGGQCYTYSSSVSSSGVANHGARAYAKRGAKSCPPDFHHDKEANLCLNLDTNPNRTFSANRCSEMFVDARPAQLETTQKLQAAVIYLNQKASNDE